MAKKGNEATYILDSKKGLPNKLLQADGTITDMLGNTVVNPDEAWDAKPALPNKWLNPDGTYSTLNEILAGMIDTSIYVIVDELPAEGDMQKIYLVSNGKGGFVEYHWTGDKWDPVGMVEFDISKYSTTQEMMNAIEASALVTLNSAKDYTDTKIAEIGVDCKTFYWDGTVEQTSRDLWNTIIQTTSELPVIVYSGDITLDYNYTSVVFLKKDTFADSSKTNYEIRFTPHVTYHSSNTTYSTFNEYRTTLNLTVENGVVTNMSLSHPDGEIEYLDINTNYTTPYTPRYPGSPATKKYVDEHTSPQVFCWDGATSQTGLDFWNNLLQINRFSDVIVFTHLSAYTDHHIAYIEKNKIYNNDNDVSIPFFANELPKTDSISYTVGSLSSYCNVRLSKTSGTITEIFTKNNGTAMQYLDISVNYSKPYTPQYDGSPATKKYVDDSIAANITNVLNGSY